MPGHATRRQVIAGVLVPRGMHAGTDAGRTRAAEGNGCRPIICTRNRTDPISGCAKNGDAPEVDQAIPCMFCFQGNAKEGYKGSWWREPMVINPKAAKRFAEAMRIRTKRCRRCCGVGSVRPTHALHALAVPQRPSPGHPRLRVPPCRAQPAPHPNQEPAPCGATNHDDTRLPASLAGTRASPTSTLRSSTCAARSSASFGG